MATIVTGDDISLAITLKKNNATFAIDSSATILANFVDTSTNQPMLATDEPILEAASGSDWPNSLVVLELTSAKSDTLTAGTARLEIQVDDDVNSNGKTTWFTTVTIKADTIP